MNRSLLRCWLLASLSAVLLAACSAPSPNSPSSGSSSGDPNKLHLAFITNNAFDFWQIARRGAEKAAEELNVDVEVKLPAEADGVAAQHRFIDDMLAKGVKGIAISPNAAEDNVDFFRNVSKKALLVTQDNDVPDPTVRKCYIGTDNYKAGRAAGELVKKAIPNGGKIVIFVGQLDATNAVERRQGVLDALAGVPEDKPGTKADPGMYGKYELIDTKTDGGDGDKCHANASDILTKYPDVDCLVGLWAYNPPKMLLAAKESKKEGKVQIVGFDEDEETLEGISKGYIIGTIVQSPYQFGYRSVQILTALAKGNANAVKEAGADAQGRIYVPHRVITKDNVAEFSAELKKLKGK
jgi:ribose transport system substrate-binding protein